MQQFDRYIAKAVLAAVLLVLLILVGLLTLFTLIEEANDIGSGGYGLWHVMQYAILQIPLRIYELFPLAVLLGTLLGLGGLANSHELIAMRAAGVPVGRILGAVYKLALPLAALVMLLGEVGAPWLEQQAAHLRALAKNDAAALRLDNGFWTRNGQVFIQVARVDPFGRLEGVHLYEYGAAHQITSMIHAQRAEYRDGQWILRQAEQTRLTEDWQMRWQALDELALPALLNPEMMNSLGVRADRMSLVSLVPFIQYLRVNGQRANEYELALWSKLAYPLVIIVLILLAAPFVFGPLRSVPISQRVLTGALLGIVFHLLNQVSGQVGLLYNYNPLLSALLPILVFSALAWGLWRRFGLI